MVCLPVQCCFRPDGDAKTLALFVNALFLQALTTARVEKKLRVCECAETWHARLAEFFADTVGLKSSQALGFSCLSCIISFSAYQSKAM